MKKLFLISFMMISNFILISANTPIFQIRPENKDFLRYLFFFNLYDSAKVIYKYGEVKLNYGNVTVPINLVHSMDTVEGKSKFGTSEQGISYDLQSLARTENFTFPNTGFQKITFFRGISESGNPCNPNLQNPGGGKGIWDIVDRTEFVLQLINANNGEIVATLDSVVSLPNSDPNADSLFGTNPHIVFHDWIVPAFLKDSTVYLRVSPRRYGPTPLGLIMQENELWANYGSLVDSSGQILGIENQNYLDSIAWIELKTYLDSCIAVDGELPKHTYHIPQNKFNDYFQLYFSDWDIEILAGDTCYTKTYYNPQFFPEYSNTNKVINPDLTRTNIKVFPSPATSNNVTIEINSPVTTYATIQFSNFGKGDIFDVWKGGISKGENKIVIDISLLPSGSYSVMLHDKNNHRSFSGNKFNIVR